MNAESITPDRGFLTGLSKIIPAAQVLGAVLFCAVGWYVGTQTAASAQNSRLEQLERRADANDRLLEKLLTREVFEAYRQGDIERTDRIEKMLIKLLDQK